MKPGFKMAIMVPGVNFQNCSKAVSNKKRSNSHFRSVSVIIMNFPRLSDLELEAAWCDFGSDLEAMVAIITMSSSISGAEKSGDLTVLKRSGITNVFFPDRMRVSSLCGIILLERCVDENGSKEEASESKTSVAVFDLVFL